MRDFDHLAHLQATDQSTEVEVGTAGAFYGVQYVDLERTPDPRLSLSLSLHWRALTFHSTHQK